MKEIVFVTFVSLTLVGCGLVNSRSVGSHNLIPTFTLTDTTGEPDTTFRSGEPFLMSFQLVNTSSDTIKYYSVYCYPSVMFAIYRNDSIVTESPTSCDNLIMQQYLIPGDTLQGEWKAPETLDSGLLNLPPDSYVAKVVFPNFSRMKGVNPVPALGFSIMK